MKLNQLFESAKPITLRAQHYSVNPIKIGEIIKSSQSVSKTSYGIVHAVYKKVARELGVYFPDHFGYAYPLDANPRDIEHLYLVEAPNEKVTQGNLNWSVYMAMAHAMSTDRSLPLETRLEQRIQTLTKWARSYFTELDDPSHIELISDVWVVKEQVR